MQSVGMVKYFYSRNLTFLLRLLQPVVLPKFLGSFYIVPCSTASPLH
jgi:hypothetical protein